MTRDDFIRMARDAGFNHFEYMAGTAPQLVRFAELLEAKVRADEREACAHIVEDWDSDLACPREVADAIRARGEK